MWISRVMGALMAAPLVAIAAQAPPPPPPPPSLAGSAVPATTDTTAVSGVVVDATTGSPIAGAVVEISLDGRMIRTDAARPRATDDRGRFLFTRLPAGTLAVRASALGYLSSGFAAEGWSPVDRFPAGPGEWVSNVRVALARPGVIAGTVLDERSEPVVGVVVGVLERVRVSGAERYMTGRAAVTDDRGQFRIIDLTPGDYLVQVPGSPATVPIDPIPTPSPGKPPAPPPDAEGIRRTYPSSFHPGVNAASGARIVSLRSGETREGIDVRLEPTRATQLTGIIEGPVEWVSGIAVRLVPEAGTGVAAEALETRADSAGGFVFDRVAEGTYTLVASRRWSELARGNRLGEPSLRSPIGVDVGGMSQDLDSGPPGLRLQTSTMSGAHPLIAMEMVVVSGPSMSGLVVRARPLATMRGRVTRDVDSRYPAPALHPAGGLRLDPVDARGELGAPRSTVRPDDPTEEFSIDGIHPGRFHLRASYGWLIKSATWNGRDFTRVPFDATVTSALDDVAVVVTNAGASVTGTVRGPGGSADAGATVVLFPVAQERWTGYGLMPVDVRRASTTADGRFTITGLPAGDYYIAATAGDGPVALHVDVFRQLQPAAMTVTLDWGASRSIDLRLTGGQP
jgi:hypothetical protein